MSHLDDIRQTYLEHLYDALGYSLRSFASGFIFLIHGVFPDRLVVDGSNMIAELNSILIIKKKKLLENLKMQ